MTGTETKCKSDFMDWLNELLPPVQALAYIKRRGINEHKAQDIYQNLTVKLYRKIDNREKIKRGYVWAALRNLVIDYYRRQAAERRRQERLKRSLSDKKVQPVKELITRAEQEEVLKRKINAYIDKLSLQQRVILKLRTHQLHKFTFGKIADIAGCSESLARMKYNEMEKQILTLISQEKDEYRYGSQ